jgi:hypothetical protein
MENDRLIYLVNNNFVLRNTDNPNWHKQKHFFVAKAVPVPHRFYPKGLVWTVNDIQNAVNDLYNQKADNIHYLLNNMMTVVDDEIIYQSDLVPAPGKRIRVRTDARAAISPIRHDNVTPDAYAQQAELMEMGQNASGIFDIVKGQMSRKETATVGSILANAASARLQLAIQRMATTALVRQFMLMVELNRQNLTIPRAIEMVGADSSEGARKFKNVTRVDLPQGYLNYVPHISIEQKKEVEAKKALDAYNLFYGKPEFNQYGLAEAAIKKSFNFATKTPLLLSKEDYTQRMDRMAKQQQALDLKGINEEAVVPPPASDVAGGGRRDPRVASQALSPDSMRQKNMGIGEERMDDLKRGEQ